MVDVTKEGVYAKGKELENYRQILKALLPEFNKNTSDVLTYFYTIDNIFEAYAVPQNIKGALVIPFLGELIRPLMVRLTPSELTDYEMIKKNIILENKLTPAERKKGFDTANKQQQETYAQFAARLRVMLQYYLDSREVKTVEEIKELLIADKFKDSLPPDMRRYCTLQEGLKWEMVDKLAELADLYHDSEVRQGGRRAGGSREVTQNQPYTSDYRYVPPHRRGDNGKGAVGTQHSNARSVRKGNFIDDKPSPMVYDSSCYNCGKIGHIARNCPTRKALSERVSRVQHVALDVVDETRQNETVVEASDNGDTRDDKVVARVSIDVREQIGIKGIRDGMANETTGLTGRFGDLPCVKVSCGGKIREAIVDTGAQITCIRDDCLKEGELKEIGRIRIKPAIGEAIEARLVEVSVALKYKDDIGTINPVVNVVAAVTPLLNVEMLLTVNDYKLLQEQVHLYYLGNDDLEQRDTRNNNDNTDNSTHATELPDRVTEVAETEKDTIEAEMSESGQTEKSEVLLLKEEQKGCETLATCWELWKRKKGNFVLQDGILYHIDRVLGERVLQLVLPEKRRKVVLSLAHESVFGAHLGIRRTQERLRYTFYWPKIKKDVTDWCNQCTNCQARARVKVCDRAPITPVTRPSLPFQVVNVDIMGPITPESRGYKYILCLVDQHTRWPEAIPLKSISAKNTCEALLTIFMRTGIPQVIATDQGANFTAQLTKEFVQRLGGSPRFSTPGHPESNGLVERWNGVLKAMLHHAISEYPKSWDNKIPFLLWAYREVPNATTGVAPFTLLYGRQPQGPLAVLRHSWVGDDSVAAMNTKTASQYLTELRKKMEFAAETAELIAKGNQAKMAAYYNRRSTVRNFEVGEQALLLIPNSNSRLYAKWTGPGTIIKRIPPHSYIVQLEDGKRCHVHVNKLRPFLARANNVGIIYEGEKILGK